MSNDEMQLKELLAYHGADVSKWPEEARPWGLAALKRLDLQPLFKEEKRFEMLLMARRMPAPSRDLAQRIIAASFTRVYERSHASVFSEIMAEIRPAALAAMLVLGFAIGFGMLSPALHDQQARVQSVADDEGAIL
jgi:hypothetical protein